MYEDFEDILSKQDCCRSFGKQCSFVSLNQTVDETGKPQQKLFVSLVAKRLYSYETSDIYGRELIPSSLDFVDTFELTFSFQVIFMTIDLKNKNQFTLTPSYPTSYLL